MIPEELQENSYQSTIRMAAISAEKMTIHDKRTIFNINTENAIKIVEPKGLKVCGRCLGNI